MGESCWEVPERLLGKSHWNLPLGFGGRKNSIPIPGPILPARMEGIYCSDIIHRRSLFKVVLYTLFGAVGGLGDLKVK